VDGGGFGTNTHGDKRHNLTGKCNMTASVAIRTFAGVLSKHLSERPNQSDTSNITILVSL